MSEADALPSYNDAKEIERRAKLAAQSSLSVDKPGKAPGKGMRFRLMRTKPRAARRMRRFNRKRPEFL